jgi:deazaflavin-dependent oxidoreductase (nitroreductase family)
MIRRVLVVIGGLSAAVLAAWTVAVLGLRFRSRLVRNAVRSFNRAVGNPRELRSAGRAGSRNSVIRHRGRTSGREYETPVTALPTADGFVIGLAYGADVDWLKNVVASGTATVLHDGRAHIVGSPEVVPLTAVAHQLPRRVVRFARVFGVDQCLVLHRAGETGTPESDRSGGRGERS